MRKVLIVMSALALCSSAAFSQGEMDAYKYAPSGELSGTARYLGMGGAFGALGGDISAMNSNPAGLGVYRSSEVVTTLSFSAIGTKTNWQGIGESNDRTKVSFDNIAYVGYFPTSNDGGIISWNVGFSYNRLKNYTRNYSMRSKGFDSSLSNYVAARATNGNLNRYDLAFDPETDYNPYENPDMNDWLAVVGFDAGYMEAYGDNDERYFSTFSDENNTPYNMTSSNLRVRETGAIDQYDIAFGMNISDLVMLGATFAVTDLKYSYESYYREDFENGNYLELGGDKGRNLLNTDGTGYSLNVGAIVRPTDFLRLGVAYNSPTWYKMTDKYHTSAGTDVNFFDKALTSYTPDDPQPYTDYQYRSPDKWLFSAAAIFGKIGLLSVDYELTNYKNMRMADYDGNANPVTNDLIKTDFGVGKTLRIGAEVKPTPQFAVRAGVAWSSSAVKNSIKTDGEEVITVGTIPNYTIDKGAMNYTIGLGYRFTPNFYADVACVLRYMKEDAYAFSNITTKYGDVVKAEAATLKTNTTKVALTLGYKF